MNKRIKFLIVGMLVFVLSMLCLTTLSVSRVETPEAEASKTSDIMGLCALLHTDISSDKLDWDGFWLCVAKLGS